MAAIITQHPYGHRDILSRERTHRAPSRMSSNDSRTRDSRLKELYRNLSRSKSNKPDREASSSFSGPTDRTPSHSSFPRHDTSRDTFPGANPSPPTRRPDRPGINAFTVPPYGPPPVYSERPTSLSGPTIPQPVAEDLHAGAESEETIANATNLVSSASQDDHPLEFLEKFDTVFLIDDSGSMAGRSWREASQAVKYIAPICTRYDKDGIDIYFLNHKTSDRGDARIGVAPGGYRNVQSGEAVENIFRAVRPAGGTPTGTRCHNILKPYLNRLQNAVRTGIDIDDVQECGVKPLNIIVITDGVPTDDVEAVLIQAAKKLDNLEALPHQVGVQFFQVGNEDGAAEALKELDDHLGKRVVGGVRDMVDTVTWTGGPLQPGQMTAKLTGESILKIVLGAVHRRYDRSNASGDHRR